ncbi:hypothetical protein [Terasakiella sp. SH-1]|uniref:hypothetical protein n=1 Tax=Terasakiella sp. SH-1 TaxID=2560057 RepID=UPI0010737CC1|nr:hypothetical protein [Terasakiella sp. SH-1]
MRIDDIYVPEDEPSAFAFTVTFENPCNATAVNIFVPGASSQVKSVNGKITVLIAALSETTEELQSMIRNAVLSCNGIDYVGAELRPTLSGGLIEVPPGFHGCRYHALHQVYPDFFCMS